MFSNIILNFSEVKNFQICLGLKQPRLSHCESLYATSVLRCYDIKEHPDNSRASDLLFKYVNLLG